MPQKSTNNILFFYLRKVIANLIDMLYNISRDGAWCSGSTWASDSHGVGSIPIAPAIAKGNASN